MYSQVIEMADATLAANKRLRTQTAELRVETNILMMKYRAHRFPHLCGASDAVASDRVRHLLHDFCAGSETLKSFVGLSRGSACQACGHVIKVDEMEYDVVVGTAELRLDADCYRVLIEERAASN